MRRRKGPSGPDIRDVKPTAVILDVRLQINGGTLSSPEIGKVWNAIHSAFEKAAHENGLGFAWMGEVGCTTPQRMERRVQKLGLNIEQPPAVVTADQVTP